MKLPKSWTKVTSFSKVFALFLFIALPIAGFVLGMYFQRVKTEQTVLVPTQEGIPSETVENSLNGISVVERPLSSLIPTWKRSLDVRGFSFYYPSDWFVYDNKGSVSTIGNWDVAKVVNPGLPMSSVQAKWDVDFSRESFTTLEDLWRKNTSQGNEGLRITSIEHGKTRGGLEIYLIEGIYPFFGNENERLPFLQAVFILSNSKYFIWNGLAFNADNIEMLKRIAESIVHE